MDITLQTRDEVLRQLRVNLTSSQNRMRQVYDRKHTDREFVVGDLVYLRRLPHRQTSVTRATNEKLAHHFQGPYCVLERVGKVAYRLELLPSAQVHPVFHVSRLRKYVSLADSSACPLLDRLEDKSKRSVVE